MTVMVSSHSVETASVTAAPAAACSLSVSKFTLRPRLQVKTVADVTVSAAVRSDTAGGSSQLMDMTTSDDTILANYPNE